jgi:hypothetical protein
MQVRYVEDLASHDDPESCVGGREAVGEALTGEHAGGAMSREKFSSGAPTLWREAEGNTGWRVTASATSALRGQETSCTRGSHLHGNREIHRLAAQARPPARSASARRNAPIR